MDYGFKFYVDGQITAMNSEFKIGNEESGPLVGPEDPSMVMMQPILQNVRISLLWFSLILLVGTQKEDYHCVSVNICLNFQPIFRNTFTARTW